MKIYDIIYLQNDASDPTWCEDKIYDTDIQYIRADIVRQEIGCVHADMGGFEKSVYRITLDGAKRIMRILEGI